MDLSKIELQLKDILAHLDSDISLVRLQEILACKHDLKLVLSNPITRDLLNMISINLRKFLLPANLYHSIQTNLANQAENSSNDGKSRSVHDIKGNML